MITTLFRKLLDISAASISNANDPELGRGNDSVSEQLDISAVSISYANDPEMGSDKFNDSVSKNSRYYFCGVYFVCK